MTQNSKGVVHLFLLVVIVLTAIAGIGYLAVKNKPQSSASLPTPNRSTTQNETVNWKTYTNTKYGYGLNYPPDAELKDLWGGNDPQESYMLRISIKDDVLVVTTSHVLSVDETLREFVERNLFNFDPQRCKTDDLTIDGHAAISVNCEASVGDKTYQQYIVYIQKDDSHVISLHPEDITPGEDDHIKVYFDQILSTFKFLDENSIKTQPIAGDGCVVEGCNSELCQGADEEPLASICLYKPDYACYKSATCERQANGKCGWTQTEALTSCLAQY